uniref:C2 domain-containing protein n=1 Tax=Anabas testudineus TaxID=64144 RepID=A0A3Q1HCC2_ANATE
MTSSLPVLLSVLCSLGLGVTDGYVKVFCNSAHLGTASVVKNNADPFWSEEFAHSKAQETTLVGDCQVQIKQGTNADKWDLKKGGTLSYTYRLCF